MEFYGSRQQLEDIFTKNGFEESVQKGLKHSATVLLESCSNGSEISVSFPGYKAYQKRTGELVYDYRIDISRSGVSTSLSHANLILDIYNKIKNGRMLGLAMSTMLMELSKEEPDDLILKHKVPYRPIKPSLELLNKVSQAHGEKQFNRKGNEVDLSLEELFLSIKWIVIQEDINYPISRGYEGRKMAFTRYLEAVFVSQNRIYSLSDLIKRTLSHQKPEPWPEMDYSILEGIG